MPRTLRRIRNADGVQQGEAALREAQLAAGAGAQDAGVVLELSGFGCLADEDMLVDGVVISVFGAVSSTFCSEFSD